MNPALPALALTALGLAVPLPLALRPLPGEPVALVFASARAAEAGLPAAAAGGWRPVRLDAARDGAGVLPLALLHLRPDADAAPPAALARASGALAVVAARAVGGCLTPAPDQG